MSVLDRMVEILRSRFLKEFVFFLRSVSDMKISQSNSCFEKNSESGVSGQFLDFDGPNGSSPLRFCFVVSSIRI